jgi:hypothetical protein
MATTTTNFGWDIPQSTDLVKDGATAIAALGQDIDTALVDLKGGTTGQVLAKASGTDLDFSWVAQDDSNAIQNSIVDAKGDLIAATANDTPARLAVGTNGYILTADSTAATGLAWAAPSASGGMTLINTGGTTLSGATTTISSIPGTYNELKIYILNSDVSDDAAGIFFRFNGDSTANRHKSLETIGASGYDIAFNDTKGALAYSNDNGTSTTLITVSIPSYANATTWKYALSLPLNNSYLDAAKFNWTQIATLYNQTSAITSLTFLPSAGTFTGGTVYVYGVK